MRVFASLTIYFALCGCAATANPTPEQLVQHPDRYEDQQVSTCGKMLVGGGKCSMETSTKEIWLSSESKLCAAHVTNSIHANVSGLFSVVGADKMLVLRKAHVEPITGDCSQSST